MTKLIAWVLMIVYLWMEGKIRIIWCERLRIRGVEANGMISGDRFGRHNIRLKRGRSVEDTFHTLLHELFHALQHEADSASPIKFRASKEVREAARWHASHYTPEEREFEYWAEIAAHKVCRLIF